MDVHVPSVRGTPGTPEPCGNSPGTPRAGNADEEDRESPVRMFRPQAYAGQVPVR